MIVAILVILAIVAIAVFTFSLCRISGQSDEVLEQQYLEMLENENEDEQDI